MRLDSLNKRLLVPILAAIALIWIAAGIATYLDAREEVDEVLDAHLAQAASLLAAQAPHELEEIDTDHAPLLHPYSRRLVFQVWEGGTVLRLRSANAPTEPLAARPGFSDRLADGHRWRVFSTWDPTHTHLIQVAEHIDARIHLSRTIAFTLLLPLLVGLPILAALLWLAIHRALRPLVELARQVEHRAPDNLAPLESVAAPHEVQPLIERLNRLFERIRNSLDNERRFTADAAHELRTPVAAIKAQAQVARGASDDAGRQRALDNAILGCDRATHLIEQLLTLARLDAARLEHAETCSLRDLAAETLAELAPTALEKNVQLALGDLADARVAASPALLRILLRNLLDNAIRHTPAGTQVEVRAGLMEGAPVIQVSDNGPGLAAEDLARLSERFFRPPGTDAPGSGLGLSIVKRIADLHGAHLSLDSSPGHGMSVRLVFAPR